MCSAGTSSPSPLLSPFPASAWPSPGWCPDRVLGSRICGRAERPAPGATRPRSDPPPERSAPGATRPRSDLEALSGRLGPRALQTTKRALQSDLEAFSGRLGPRAPHACLFPSPDCVCVLAYLYVCMFVCVSLFVCLFEPSQMRVPRYRQHEARRSKTKKACKMCSWCTFF